MPWAPVPKRREHDLMAAKKGRTGAPPPEWKNVFYVTPRRDAPALTWINGIPGERRRELLAWAEVIRTWPGGPFLFPPGLIWQPMHDDAAGCFEIREEHDKIRYRLFCVIDRKALENGLANPVVCFLDGATKPIQAALPPATYTALKQMRKDYLATNPRRVR